MKTNDTLSPGSTRRSSKVSKNATADCSGTPIRASTLPEQLSSLLMEHTRESPLLLVGLLKRRLKLTGRSHRGSWEMLKAEVQGVDGRVLAAVITDPATLPEAGSMIVLPVIVGNNGHLRQAKDNAVEF